MMDYFVVNFFSPAEYPLNDVVISPTQWTQLCKRHFSFLWYSKHPVNNPCPTLLVDCLCLPTGKETTNPPSGTGGSCVRFISFKAGGLYEATGYCLLPPCHFGEENYELSAEPRPLKQQKLGLRAVSQREGQGTAKCSLVPWSSAERRPRTLQQGALPENQICRQREAWPFVLSSGFFSCFPSDTGFWENEGKYLLSTE